MPLITLLIYFTERIRITTVCVTFPFTWRLSGVHWTQTWPLLLTETCSELFILWNWTNIRNNVFTFVWYEWFMCRASLCFSQRCYFLIYLYLIILILLITFWSVTLFNKNSEHHLDFLVFSPTRGLIKPNQTFTHDPLTCTGAFSQFTTPSSADEVFPPVIL